MTATRPTFHPVAQRCLTWAIALFVVATAALAFGPNAYWAVAERMGANAEAGLWLLTTVMTFAQNALFPLAAVLVGATVVIQVLGSRPTTTPDP